MVYSVCWIEANNTSGFKPFAFDNLLKHYLGVVKQLSGFLTHSLIVKDLWVCAVGILASNLPALEEWVPVDKR